MKLNDLVQHIPHTGASDAEISAITYDSRKAAAGSLFVCLVGAWLDGRRQRLQKRLPRLFVRACAGSACRCRANHHRRHPRRAGGHRC